MNVAACTILRHQPRIRHGLGIAAIYCDCCVFDLIEPLMTRNVVNDYASLVAARHAALMLAWDVVRDQRA